MAKGINKRIVVIKDINSSFIEEAILILKNDPRDRASYRKSISGINIIQNNKRGENNYLVKEAEKIIDSYIRASSNYNNLADFKPNNTKRVYKSKVNLIINVFLIGSIAALLYIVLKFM